MEKEIWKDILGYEGLYQVSNLGKVKSMVRQYKSVNIQKEINKAFSKLPRGYLRVGLSKNGKTNYYYVHRLVAEAFIPNLQNKPCINHKDCNPQNNRIDNLEWCTHKENNEYKNHFLRRKITSIISTLKKQYPDEKQIINEAEKLKEKIKMLS